MKYIVKMQIGMHNVLKYACIYEIIETFRDLSAKHSIKVLELIHVNCLLDLFGHWITALILSQYIYIYMLLEIEIMIYLQTLCFFYRTFKLFPV